MEERTFEICDIFPDAQEHYSMSKEEMLDYFNERSILLSPDLAESIYTDTEGWVCAIHLISRILEQQPELALYAADAVKECAMKAIEIGAFSAMESDMQDLLVKISLIDHPAVSLIKQICEPALPEKLELLAGKNAFIRYEAHTDSYHIHTIFSELLHKKANALPKEEINAVLSAAATWSIEHEYILDALKYYDRIGDYESFLNIAFELSLVIPKDIMNMIVSIIEHMPAEVSERDDRVYILYSRMLMNLGRMEEAVSFIVGKLEKLNKLPTSEYKNRLLFGLNNNLGYISMIQSLYNGRYDFEGHFKTADAYFRLCKFTDEIRPVSFSLGPFVIRVGNRHKGEFEKYILALKNSVPYVSHLANGTMSGLYELAISEYAYYTGDMNTCERFAYRSINNAKAHMQYEIENRALFFLLRRNLSSGKVEDIREIYEKITRQPMSSDYPERYKMMDIITSWLFAQIGHGDRIAYWIKRDIDDKVSNFARKGLEFFTRSKYLLLDAQYQQLLVLLESQEHERGISAFLIGLIGIYRDRAICYYHLKDRKAAMKAFEEAYRLARPNAIITVFTESGNDMRSLCAFALKYERCKIPDEWLKMINAKASTYAKRLAQAEALFEHHEAIRPVALTKTEYSVLTKLSKGMSRQDIAEENKISINTIKTIIGDAINKLGAHNATEAVSIAIRRGLI